MSAPQDKDVPISLYDQRPGVKLRICIVGCGLGGLAAAYCLGQSGHEIIMVESKLSVGEIGAGIHCTPNVMRLFLRWGLGQKLKKVAVKPGKMQYRNWKSGDILLDIPLADVMEKEHGAPYYQLHRAELFNILLDFSRPFVKELRIGSKVVSMSSSTVTLEDGQILENLDMILGADGIRSITRSYVLGDNKLEYLGEAAFRATIPREVMLQDEEMRELIDTPGSIKWLGERRHIIGYGMRAGQEYNVVMIHPDSSESNSWLKKGDRSKMLATYEGWNPKVQKLFSLMDTILHTSFTTCAFGPDDSWVHKDWNLALLGDACHPMVPYRAQGAAMAFEDAAVLGNLFSRITDRSQVHKLLSAYEKLRRPRATDTQRSSWAARETIHLPDGPAQEARDKMWKNPPLENPKADEMRESDRLQFAYDADAEVDTWWKNNKGSVLV